MPDSGFAAVSISAEDEHLSFALSVALPSADAGALERRPGLPAAVSSGDVEQS